MSLDSLKKTRDTKKFLDIQNVLWWSYRRRNIKGVWKNSWKTSKKSLISILLITSSFFIRFFRAMSHSKELIKLYKNAYFEIPRMGDHHRKKMRFRKNSDFFRCDFLYCKPFFEDFGSRIGNSSITHLVENFTHYKTHIKNWWKNFQVRSQFWRQRRKKCIFSM